jgi:hypothetical protein
VLACSPGTGPTATTRDAGLSEGRDAAAPADALDGAAAVRACAWTPGDHASACPTTPCPIVEDVSVTCADAQFAQPGLRVAPAPGATWLVTASANDRYAFAIHDGQGIQQPGLPLYFANTTLSLALSPGGEPSVATDPWWSMTEAGIASGTQYEALGPDGWLGWLAQPSGAPGRLGGLQVGADGIPDLWVGGETFQQVTEIGGASAFADAPLPAGDIAFPHFTLARDGEPVSFQFASPDAGQSPQLHALLGGIDRPVGAALTGASEAPYSVADFPSPSQPATGALTAVALQGVDGIHVAWFDAQGSAETVIPSTPALAYTCPSIALGSDGTCPSDRCHETATGLVPHWDSLSGDLRSFALAWTSDGVAWLAYVRTQIDAEDHYVLGGNGEEVWCTPTADSSSVSTLLHVVRVPLDGSPPVDVLSLPISPVSEDYPGNSVDAGLARYFDAQASGTDLAIAFRTVDASDAGDVSTVRVLRIDTTALSR